MCVCGRWFGEGVEEGGGGGGEGGLRRGVGGAVRGGLCGHCHGAAGRVGGRLPMVGACRHGRPPVAKWFGLSLTIKSKTPRQLELWSGVDYIT